LSEREQQKCSMAKRETNATETIGKYFDTIERATGFSGKIG